MIHQRPLNQTALGPASPRFVCLDNDLVVVPLTPGCATGCLPGLFITLSPSNATALLELTDPSLRVSIGKLAVVDVAPLSAGQVIHIDDQVYTILMPLQVWLADANLRSPRDERRRQLLMRYLVKDANASAIIPLQRRTSETETSHPAKRRPTRLTPRALAAGALLVAGVTAVIARPHIVAMIASPSPTLVEPTAASKPAEAIVSQSKTVVSPQETDKSSANSISSPPSTDPLKTPRAAPNTTAQPSAPSPVKSGTPPLTTLPHQAHEEATTAATPISKAAARPPSTPTRSLPQKVSANSPSIAAGLDTKSLTQHTQRLQELTLLAGFDPDRALAGLRKLAAEVPPGSALSAKINSELGKLQP